jgi:hypothetical protein
MKKILTLGTLALAFAFTACDDSTSSSSETNGNAGKSATKGSFPQGGDSDFYCIADSGVDENGNNWSEIRVNIPKYRGHVERITYDAAGNGTQYYEETYFSLNSVKQAMMCLEFNDEIEKKSAKYDFADTYCENGVSYFVVRFQDVDVEEELAPRIEYFKEDCEDYKQEWESGEYDDYRP